MSSIDLAHISPQPCNVDNMAWAEIPLIQNAIEETMLKEFTLISSLPNANTSTLTFRLEKDPNWAIELGSVL